MHRSDLFLCSVWEDENRSFQMLLSQNRWKETQIRFRFAYFFRFAICTMGPSPVHVYAAPKWVPLSHTNSWALVHVLGLLTSKIWSEFAQSITENKTKKLCVKFANQMEQMRLSAASFYDVSSWTRRRHLSRSSNTMLKISLRCFSCSDLLLETSCNGASKPSSSTHRWNMIEQRFSGEAPLVVASLLFNFQLPFFNI